MQTGIEKIIALNEYHSKIFTDPKTFLERKLYRAKHSTEIAALKCMDGRLHLPVMTETALGLIQPWRNLGGRFDLGWPAFKEGMEGWVEYSSHKGRKCLVFITYHWSKGDTHRGCRGFNYDKEAAVNAAMNLKKQYDYVFGKGPVYALVCGIETDEDGLVLHGNDNTTLDLEELENTVSSEELLSKLQVLYPDMDEDMTNDLLPLVEGNVRHIAEIRRNKRPIADSEHREWVLGIGRGFDWLHEINMAFIIGHFDPDLRNTIKTGASLLQQNIEAGRVDPKNGIVLMTSAPYRHTAGYEQRLAEQKARFFKDFALDIIKTDVPELMEHLQSLAVTVDMNTRKINILE